MLYLIIQFIINIILKYYLIIFEYIFTFLQSFNIDLFYSMTTETKMEYVTLNNGVKMPMVFFGTFQIPPKETEKAVSEALKLGYRAIDTAQGYMNEKGVGDAVRKSGIPRD